jgi:hypothetical protein
MFWSRRLVDSHRARTGVFVLFQCGIFFALCNGVTAKGMEEALIAVL